MIMLILHYFILHRTFKHRPVAGHLAECVVVLFPRMHAMPVSCTGVRGMRDLSVP